MNPPALRRLTAIAWYCALGIAVPAAVAFADGLLSGQSVHSMFPDVLATLVTLAIPVWPLTLFAGSVALRRSDPTLTPADACYPGSRRLGGLILAGGALVSLIEVLAFAFWPGRQDPGWFGSAAGLCAAFVGLAILSALAVRFKERRLALGLWTDPRAIWQRLGEAGGSAHPAVAIYYGRGPDAPLNA